MPEAGQRVEGPHSRKSSHFCSTPPPGAVVPQLGDRVVAFAQLPGQDVFREFMVIDPRSGLIVQRRGALLGATTLDSGAAADIEAVLAAVGRSCGPGS